MGHFYGNFRYFSSSFGGGSGVVSCFLALSSRICQSSIPKTMMIRSSCVRAVSRASWAMIRLSGLRAMASSGSTAQPQAPASARPYKTIKTKRTEGDDAPKVPHAASCGEEGPAPVRPLTPLQKRQYEMKDKKMFSLTGPAVYRIKSLLQQQQGQPSTNSEADGNSAPAKELPIGIRIGVKKRGCSGYSYTVNYQYESHPPMKPNDVRVEQSGVRVFVDGDALFYVIGTEMDYFTSNVEEKFIFKNPNEKESCGCGESFMPFGA